RTGTTSTSRRRPTRAARCGTSWNRPTGADADRLLRVRRPQPAPAGVRSRRVSVEGVTGEELQLAARNHGLPLEALREPITPVGLHYLLIHFDIPQVDVSQWEL